MFKIIINNRNRLTTTKNMVEHLLKLNANQEIIIIDNGSTYEPLLEWYNEVNNRVDVKMNKNNGHLALWSTGLYKEVGDYFIYTDSDIELNENTPVDFQQIMFNVMQEFKFKKVALAFRIDDIPDYYKYKTQVIQNESRWWMEEVGEDLYKADTDTTFALMENIGDNMYPSIRIARKDLICRHKPFYIDLENLDTEEAYYINNNDDYFCTQYTKQHKYKDKFN